MLHNDRYPCPCCGYYTLPAKPPGTHEVCAICRWEDVPYDWHTLQYGGYIGTLIQAQHSFWMFGASSADGVGSARKPSEHDRRVADWRPLERRIEDERVDLIEEIREAFRDVRLDGGISIQQAEVLDAYGSARAYDAAHQAAPDERWQDIPLNDLVSLNALVFLDPKGLRYYLPAFTIFSLNHLPEGFNTINRTQFQVDSMDASQYGILDRRQCHALIRFSFFMMCFVNRQRAPDEHARHIRDRWGVQWDDQIVARFRY